LNCGKISTREELAKALIKIRPAEIEKAKQKAV